MGINNSTAAEKLAINTRKELGISTDVAIDFTYIFQKLNIHFKRARLANGILGASKVEGLNRLIVVSNRERYAAQERFTTAHELGHIMLRHGYSQCKYADIFTHRTHKEKKLEANAFASSLLLPPGAVTKYAQRNEVTINAAGKLAKQYNVSLTSALTALVKSSPLSVCAFFQSNGKIDYSISSPNCCVRARTGQVFPGSGIQAVGSRRHQYKGNCECSVWFYEKPNIEVLY